MMTRNRSYYTLVGSLPALPRHFEEAERVPISRLDLVERLKMLTPEDAKVVEEMTDFLAWERQPLERTDRDIVIRFNRFMETVDNRFAQDLIRFAVNVRTLIAALRCRRLGLDPPVGVEPLAGRITREWGHPEFRLRHEYRWISEVDNLLNGTQLFELERLIYGIVWQHVKKLSEHYQFTFEAVLLYLIRWEIVFRWTQRDSLRGRERFEGLVTEAMGPYAEIFPG